MRRQKRPMTNVLLAGTLIMGSGTVAAKPAQQALDPDAAPPEAGSLATGDVGDERMHRFIEAAHDVVALRKEYAHRINNAPEPERAELQIEAAERMTRAIEDQGLDLAEYREIGHLLESDPDLQDDLEAVATRTPG